MLFRIPTDNSGALPFAEKFSCTPTPIAIPMGVIRVNARPMIQGVHLLAKSSKAIRAPRARPSKNWWKMMTMRRVLQPSPPPERKIYRVNYEVKRRRRWYIPAPSVTPIMIEWKMIPASKIITCQCWSLPTDSKANPCE